MSRLSHTALSDHARTVREEAVEAGRHVLATAQEAANLLGERSRNARTTARERAALAALALRGERPSFWPWLAAGFAAGIAVGTVAGMVLGRQPLPAALANGDEDRKPMGDALTDRARTMAETVKDKTTAAAHNVAETVKDKTTAAAHDAASTARETATRVRERLNRESVGAHTDGTGSPSTA